MSWWSGWGEGAGKELDSHSDEGLEWLAFPLVDLNDFAPFTGLGKAARKIKCPGCNFRN